MALQVVPYDSSWKAKWDEFVLSSNNGTIFHLQRFLEYHPKGRFDWNHLLFVDRGAIVAVLPAARMGSTLESPIGASYGSVVTRDISFALALELVDCLGDYCRDEHFERALLTAAPFIYQRNISQDLDYALAYRGFQIDKHYISHAIPLRGDDFVSSFHGTARRYVHKYIRESPITIERSDDLASFYPILLENKKRHRAKPTHTLSELQKLQRSFPEDILLFLARKGRKPIAGSVVFRCNKQVALCFYNMLLYKYEDLNPIHALMYEVTKWAVEEGCTWLDIGVSQDTSAEDQMTPAMSLIHFKEQFAARGILRSTYYRRFI